MGKRAGSKPDSYGSGADVKRVDWTFLDENGASMVTTLAAKLCEPIAGAMTIS